jgi:hypothetical protein
MKFFKPGDFAVVVNPHSQQNAKYQGEICEILSWPRPRWHRANRFLYIGWRVRMLVDGAIFWVEPRCIARKPTPRKRKIDRVVRWNDCPWQPATSKESEGRGTSA